MAEETEAPDSGDAAEENKPEYPKDAKPWLKMITQAQATFETYFEKCDSIAKQYANLAMLSKGRTDREFQMLYANLEVVKPSIMSRSPQPVVVPRFKDRKPVPRKASEMLERALITSFDTEKVFETLKKVRDDLALCARGVIWNRYETYEKGGKPKECVRYEWLYRRDFLHEPARIWSEVGWVARGTWLTKEQGETRFKSAWTKDISYEDSSDTAEDYKVQQKARVWELWHKDEDVVVWLHPNCPDVLEIAPPHLTLEGFFPCPRPAYSTVEPDSLIPVPDACFYKDQLEEINELTARISALAESLRLVGFYAAGAEDLGTAIETALQQVKQGENRRVAVPLPGMSSFGGGNLKDAIVWLPVVEVANTVKELVALRRQLIDDVYQISGISDIMRGDTEASETLGAQQLKSQYGSIRIKDRQNEMVRVADGTLNIAGEIMAENFNPVTLMAMSQTEDLPKQADIIKQHQAEVQQQIQQLAAQAAQPQQGEQGSPPADPQQMAAKFEQARQEIIVKAQKAVEEVVTVEKVFGLFKSDNVRPFILQIATDSTIQPDENAEKKARAEFGAAFAQTMTALGPLVQAAPAESADFAGEMLKFEMAPYRAGRAMEQAIDDLVEQLKAKAKQPPAPNPEQMKIEAEVEGMKQDQAAKAADLENSKAERDAKAQEQARSIAADEKAAQRQAELDAFEASQRSIDAQREAGVKDREAQARLAEIDRKTASDVADRQHQERMRELEYDLKLLDKEIAELKLQQARTPKPATNGNGAEHGHR